MNNMTLPWFPSYRSS